MKGNGTVRMTGTGEATKAYLAEIGGETLVVLANEVVKRLHSFTTWQGLKLGEKYTMTVVPYNLKTYDTEKEIVCFIPRGSDEVIAMMDPFDRGYSVNRSVADFKLIGFLRHWICGFVDLIEI